MQSRELGMCLVRRSETGKPEDQLLLDADPCFNRTSAVKLLESASS